VQGPPFRVLNTVVEVLDLLQDPPHQIHHYTNADNSSASVQLEGSVTQLLPYFIPVSPQRQ
jgi:hypothetical protein